MVEEEDANDASIIMQGSEFENLDGRLYRVVDIDLSTNTVRATCFYPLRNNVLFGVEKSFEFQLTKELIELRLNG